MNINTKLSEHFTLAELIHSDTAVSEGIDNTPPECLIPNLSRLCHEILEPVRLHFSTPFSPNSGYRCPELNSSVGGSTNSQHCKAEAVDIKLRGISNYDLAVWIRDHLEYDQLILENYKPDEPHTGWVHISLKGDSNRKAVLTCKNNKYENGLLT